MSASQDIPATAAHRRGVVRVLLGLIGFALIYLAIIIGCIAAPLVLLRAALREPIAWLVAAPALPLFVTLKFVLLRKLVRRAPVSASALPVTPEQQPRLFEFIARSCAEARAPMPDRVSLGVDVNAAMLRSSVLGSGARELVLGLERRPI